MPSEQAEDMQARINRLESLVTTLVKQNQQLASSDGTVNHTSVDQITPFSSDGSDNGITEEIQQGIGTHISPMLSSIPGAISS